MQHSNIVWNRRNEIERVTSSQAIVYHLGAPNKSSGGPKLASFTSPLRESAQRSQSLALSDFPLKLWPSLCTFSHGPKMGETFHTGSLAVGPKEGLLQPQGLALIQAKATQTGGSFFISAHLILAALLFIICGRWSVCVVGVAQGRKFK